MGDQKRWFKLWCAAPDDDDLQRRPPALRWAWAALGAYTKLHGTAGVLRVSPANATLAAQMGVPLEALFTTLLQLPSIYIGEAEVRWPHGKDKPPVCAGAFVRGSYPLNGRGGEVAEEWCRHNGDLVVTWKYWHKFQEDSTAAERGRVLRSKRRREEKRGEEKRIPPTGPPDVFGEVEQSTKGADADIRPVPPSILLALDQARILGAVPRLREVKFWQAEIRATAGRLDYAGEVLRAEAWLTANPARAPRKDLPRFLHNWLSRAGGSA